MKSFAPAFDALVETLRHEFELNGLQFPLVAGEYRRLASQLDDIEQDLHASTATISGSYHGLASNEIVRRIYTDLDGIAGMREQLVPLADAFDNLAADIENVYRAVEEIANDPLVASLTLSPVSIPGYNIPGYNDADLLARARHYTNPLEVSYHNLIEQMRAVTKEVWRGPKKS